jgi:hypothetical protein
LLAVDAPAELRRQLFGRKVVFHLKELKPEYSRALQAFPFVSGVQTVERRLLATVRDPESENPALVRALVEAGAEVQFVGELRQTLEDVYMALMKGGGAPRPLTPGELGAREVWVIARKEWSEVFRNRLVLFTWRYCRRS